MFLWKSIKDQVLLLTRLKSKVFSLEILIFLIRTNVPRTNVAWTNVVLTFIICNIYSQDLLFKV